MENHSIPTNRSHHHLHHSGGGGGGGGREDCWSEAATAVLIDAWGDRYLQLSKGNLRQKDWKDVADAVNNRQDTVNKPRKTDVQCKNRIDTIKKKYKLERSKSGPSKWPFYTHLDDLIGANVTPKPPPPPPLSAITFKKSIHNHNPNPRLNHSHNHTTHNHTHTPHNHNLVLYSGGSSSKSRINSSGSSGSSRGGGDDDDEEDYQHEDDDGDVGGGLMNNGGGGGKRKTEVAQNLADGEGLKELAKAIMKFGEVYERIESSKQEQIMELERQRMEFTKDLEFKRMQMFMEAQLELQKTKRPKYAPGSGKKL